MKCCLELDATPALQTLDVFWMLQIRFKIKVIHTVFHGRLMLCLFMCS